VTGASSRQVLYAAVGAGFLMVVAVLIGGAAVAGLAPGWWTATTAALWSVAAVGVGMRWRRTGLVLAVTIGLFAVWTIGTLAVT